MKVPALKRSDSGINPLTTPKHGFIKLLSEVTRLKSVIFLVSPITGHGLIKQIQLTIIDVLAKKVDMEHFISALSYTLNLFARCSYQ